MLTQKTTNPLEGHSNETKMNFPNVDFYSGVIYRALGIPISLNKVPVTDPPVDGYQILKVDYEADHPVLEADEIAALHLASNLFHLSGEDTESIFYKMGGVLQENKSALSEIPTEVLDKKIMIGMLVVNFFDKLSFFNSFYFLKNLKV